MTFQDEDVFILPVETNKLFLIIFQDVLTNIFFGGVGITQVHINSTNS